MNRLLVPVDFSQESSYALDFAIEFNKFYHGDIVLLHVLEGSKSKKVRWEEGDNLEDLFGSEKIQEVTDLLRSWLERVEKAGYRAAYSLKAGNTYKNISIAIAEEHATLIVMSAHGSSGLKQVLSGSHSKQVVRFADCPVLTVKGSTEVSDIKEMVFASDLSEDQHAIMDQAKSLQEILGEIPFHILYVRTKHNQIPEDEEEVLTRMEEFVANHDVKNYTLNTILAEQTYEGILEFTKKKNIGLVAIGTHGKTGIAHLFEGSRAEELIEHSKIPVLTYKIFD